MSGDPVANVLRARGRLTRANYLALNYLGRPPLDSEGRLPPELEQEMPEELREPDSVAVSLAANDDIPDPATEFDRILFVLVQERE